MNTQAVTLDSVSFDQQQRSSIRTRRSLLDTPVWNTPFQLLPRMHYQGKELERTLSWQNEFSKALPDQPKFIICTAVGEDTIDDLWSLFATVASQSYPNLELVVGAATVQVRDEVRTLFEEYQIPGEVFLFVSVEQTSGLSDTNGKKSSGFFEHVGSFLRGSPAKNGANPSSKGGASEQHIVVVQPDALLHPSALFIAAKQILKRSTDLMYANEVILADDVSSSVAYLRRSPVDKYSMLSSNTVGNLLILSSRAVDYLIESGENFVSRDGFRIWPLAAELVARELRRGFIPLGLLHTRESSPLSRGTKKQREATEADLKSELQMYSRRVGLPLRDVEFQDHPSGFFALPHPNESAGAIQVVIPYHNQSATTINCLVSLSQQVNASELHVTLVDNNSESSEHAAIDARAQELGFAHLSHLLDDGYFNFARLNNLGTTAGDSPFILFLNNDVELSERNSIRKLRDWCALSDVGAVGGLLKYPNGRTQHAGINFLSVRPANVNIDDHYQFLTREVNAVTFAMALVKREAFNGVGGLNEFLCPNGFGDALFCLELRKKGYRSIFTPLASGVHHESLSRGRTSEELELLEMTQAGLPITDLYADFYAELQPMRVALIGAESGDFDRVVQRIKRSPRIGALANALCKIALFPIRMFQKI